MICLVALVVFGVLGVFSARYRGIAKEAFNCVFRRVTLRPCSTGFDKRLKSQITARLMRFPRAARFVYRRFEILSWILTISMMLSLAYSAIAVYNLATTGSCDPHGGACIFRPGAISCGSEHCATQGCTCGPKETNCTAANAYAACGGNCTCNKQVCG